jgi:hypothetical protein
MNSKQFYDAVVRLRHYQKEYFKTHTREALKQSISSENLIDQEIERVNTILKQKENASKYAPSKQTQSK